MTDRPEWDEARARALIGSRVLVGVTRANPTGDTLEQLFGTVISADRTHGFEIELEGSRRGGVYWLPPQLDNFQAAPPGQYRLRSTGEVVIDPDYLATWIVEPPAS